MLTAVYMIHSNDYGLENDRPQKKRRISEAAAVAPAGDEEAVAADVVSVDTAAPPKEQEGTHVGDVSDDGEAAPEPVAKQERKPAETKQKEKEKIPLPEPDRRKSRKRARPQPSARLDALKLKVAELRAELKKRGLKSTGVKAVLLNRLLDAYAREDKKADSIYGAIRNNGVIDVDGVEEVDQEAVHEASSTGNGAKPRATVSASAGPDIGHGKGDSSDDEAEYVDASDGRRRFVRRPSSASDDFVRDSLDASFDFSGRAAELPSPGVRPVPASKPQDPPSPFISPGQRLYSSASEVGAALTIVDEGEENSSAPAQQGSPKNPELSTQQADDHDELAQPQPEQTSLVDEATDSPAATRREPSPQPGSVGWLHSRALVAVKALTESKSEQSGGLSLLARGFKAFSEAIAPSSSVGTSESAAQPNEQETSVTIDSSKESSTNDADQVVTPRQFATKSSLRETGSLPTSNSLSTLKVSFARFDAVDTIAEESHTDTAASEFDSSQSESRGEGRARSASLPKGLLSSQETVMTPAPSTANGIAEKSKSVEANKSGDASRYLSEDDSRSQSLRLTAKQSAKKRIEETNAAREFWAKREQLKLKLQAQSQRSATEVVDARTDDTGSSVSSAVKTSAAAQARSTITASISPIQDGADTDRETLGSVGTVAQSKQTDVRPRVTAPSQAKSAKHGADKTRANDSRHTDKSAVTAQGTSSLPRPRQDSMSSTVSSVPSSPMSQETAPHGKASSSATTAAASSNQRRPLPNLVSGVHSFATLVDKNATVSTVPHSTTRSVPVNSLKLAEKTRRQEEKKKLEKLKRKEARVKMYADQRKHDEENFKKVAAQKEEEKKKKAAAAKEKAEHDAKLKREQERKQLQIELAKKRQQKLQEVRAGIEKKRQLAAAAELEKSRAAQMPPSRSQVNAAGSSHPPTSPPPRPTKMRPVRNSNGRSKAPAAAVSSSAAPPAQVSAAGPSTNAKAPNSANKNGKTRVAPADEVASYQLSDNNESDSHGSDSEEEERRRRDGKDIPRWAQRENLDRALRSQFGPNAVDPTPSIFPDFADTCDLEAIFDTSDARRRKRFGRRTSSGNWFGDRPTARDRALYRHDMGFSR